MLVAEQITKIFGTTRALQAVSCRIEPGTITAVIGPSGSGKSTLLRALALIDPPDRGLIAIDGIEYRYPDEDDALPAPPWPRLTVVFQQLFLWPHLSLRENIMMPARYHRCPDAEGRLSELASALGMAGFLDRYPNQTSLGQRQRAAIARALILEPTYVLFDEVTSSLDVESIAAIVAQLQALRTRGLGILLITHALGFARRSADRVLFLDQGEVLEYGGSSILDAPQHPRVRQFLQLLEATQ